MKKHKDIRRFYFFDYLFWVGEKLNQRFINKFRRIDGASVVNLYLMLFILWPMVLVFVLVFDMTEGVEGFIGVMVVCSLGWFIPTKVENIYSKRRDAVMKHYSNRYFNPFMGWIIALLPIVIILVALCLPVILRN